MTESELASARNAGKDCWFEKEWGRLDFKMPFLKRRRVFNTNVYDAKIVHVRHVLLGSISLKGFCLAVRARETGTEACAQE